MISAEMAEEIRSINQRETYEHAHRINQQQGSPVTKEDPAITARRAELAAEREAERMRLVLKQACWEIEEEARAARAQELADRKAGYL